VVHTAYKKVGANIDLIRARPYDHGCSYATALLTSTQDLRTLGAPSPLWAASSTGRAADS
jgi:hypothetical protein